MRTELGTAADIVSWMALVERVAWNFPGLETPEALAEHRDTVLRFMDEGRALCVKENGAVIGASDSDIKPRAGLSVFAGVGEQVVDNAPHHRTVSHA